VAAEVAEHLVARGRPEASHLHTAVAQAAELVQDHLEWREHHQMGMHQSAGHGTAVPCLVPA
jgi:hypothetical protein